MKSKTNGAEVFAILMLMNTSVIPCTHCQTKMESYVQLDEYIHNCEAFKHKVPPTANGHTFVNFSFEPFQVQSVNDVLQTVSLAALLTIWWDIPECGWDPKDYNGIRDLDIDSREIWKPSISVPKAAQEPYIHIPNSVTIYYNSSIQALCPGGLHISCYLDLTYYPFDEHNCTILFVEMHDMHLHSINQLYVTKTLKEFFRTSAEWHLLDGDCSSVPFIKQEYAQCWISIKRKSSFYIATFLFPIVLMSSMTLLVFCIPAESGEKMSFVVAIFVSMTVFVNFVVDMIPRSMDKLPRIIALLMTVIVTIGLAAGAATFVLKRYEEEKKEMEKEAKHYEDTVVNQEQFREPFSRPDVSNSEDYRNNELINNVYSSGQQVDEVRSIVGNLVENQAKADQRNGDHFNYSSSLICPSNKNGRCGDESHHQQSGKGGSGANASGRKRSSVTGIMGAGAPCLPKMRLSHRQLDRIFFCFFLVVNLAVYIGIMID